MATSNLNDLDEFTRGTNGADVITDTNGNDDYIKGEDGADRINGGAGNDVLDGGSDNDNLAGGLGDDILIGGSGNDILTSDAGADVVQGGYGSDEFRITTFNFNGPGDFITDFRVGTDTLTFLSGVTISDATRGSSNFQLSAEQVDKFGLDQNDLASDDLFLTVTNAAGTASQTYVFLDAFQFASNEQWDAYLTTLGFPDFV